MLSRKNPLYRAVELDPDVAALPAKSKPASVNRTASYRYLTCHWLRGIDGALTMAWSLNPDGNKAPPHSNLTDPLNASSAASTAVDRLASPPQPENAVRALVRHFAIAALLAAAALGTLACFLLEPSTPYF